MWVERESREGQSNGPDVAAIRVGAYGQQKIAVRKTVSSVGCRVEQALRSCCGYRVLWSAIGTVCERARRPGGGGSGCEAEGSRATSRPPVSSCCTGSGSCTGSRMSRKKMGQEMRSEGASSSSTFNSFLHRAAAQAAAAGGCSRAGRAGWCGFAAALMASATPGAVKARAQ